MNESEIRPTMLEDVKSTKIPVTTATRPREVLNASSNDLKEYLKQQSSLYGVDYAVLTKVVNCESSWNSSARTSVSYGIAQFTKPTFKEYCKGEYTNAKDQLTCMASVFKKKMMSRWDCWRSLYGTK